MGSRVRRVSSGIAVGVVALALGFGSVVAPASALEPDEVTNETVEAQSGAGDAGDETASEQREGTETDPNASPSDVTVAVTGTLQSVVIESGHDIAGEAEPEGGAHTHAETPIALVTDEGTHLSVDPESLASAAGVDPESLSPASTFSGELALSPEAAESVAEAGFEVSAGETIDASEGAGSAALDALLAEPEAATVAAATVVPAAAETAAAAPAHSHHRIYVAVIGNRGAQGSYSAAVEKARAYWQTQGNGYTTVSLAGTKTYTAAKATQSNSCGMESSFDAVITEAAAQFPGVAFSTAQSASPNHLVVLAPSACTNGYLGLAYVGAGLRSGGAVVAATGSEVTTVIPHEIGHNLSLEHSGVLPVENPNADPCALDQVCFEYGDLSSLMASARSTRACPC
ncbi:MAG: M12 family metallo-peptidase [Leucobacter sp.]